MHEGMGSHLIASICGCVGRTLEVDVVAELMYEIAIEKKPCL